MMMRRAWRRVARFSSSRDESEIAKFEGFRWRDKKGNGGAAPLHALNPVRVDYIAERVGKSLQGLRVVDVGCGGGLLSVALASRGAKVTGVDASASSIEAARKAAEEAGVEIDLVHGGAEDLDDKFDVVCALEVIEHVRDPKQFVDSLSRLTDNHLFVSTIDRSFLGYALAIFAAENVLGILPRGTHNWHKFVKPSELAVYLGHNNLPVRDIAALNYLGAGPSLPVQRAWRSTYVPGRSINYILHASSSS